MFKFRLWVTRMPCLSGSYPPPPADRLLPIDPGLAIKMSIAMATELSLFSSVQAGSAAHPVFYSAGTGSSFLRRKRPGREADTSSSSLSQVKDGGAISLLPHTFSRRAA